MERKLLLNHIFEQLNPIAIEFKTHWHNYLASQQAISRLGAIQHGIFRYHQIGVDDFYRDTVFSTIAE